MKIGFVFTNYNNSSYTKKLINSIIENGGARNFNILIVDNNSNNHEKSKLKKIAEDSPSIELILNDHNLGYFKGLNCGIKQLRKKNCFDYIVVGNNDLIFPKDFIATIEQNRSKLDKYPIISPDVITLDGMHQNPHVISRIGIFRELMYDLYHFRYEFAVLIRWMAKITKRITDRKDEKYYKIAQEIHQGYGAVYILGPLFFKHFTELWAPTFLMGEEMFLSIQLNTKGFKIYYEPSIVVKHHLHAARSKMPNKVMWKIAQDSHRVYRKHVKIWRSFNKRP